MTIIDINTFNILKESTDAEFIRELINTFLEDAPMQIQQMKDALVKKDAESFKRAAHTVKSNAATFGRLNLQTSHASWRAWGVRIIWKLETGLKSWKKRFIKPRIN